jgi:hypothetical protein
MFVGGREKRMSDMEIDKLIDLHDETLREISLEWKTAKSIVRKEVLMHRINKALDYRLKLMAIRDGKK